MNEQLEIQQVIRDYDRAFELLDRYDHQPLDLEGSTKTKTTFQINYAEAKGAIAELARFYGQEPGLFGLEKDDSFQGALSVVYQTHDGQELYPSLEEKAAHLLYFLVKDHCFVDGNKRIAAFLFVWFLAKNGALYREDGRKRVDNMALAALTLMVAMSPAGEMEGVVGIIANFWF